MSQTNDDFSQTTADSSAASPADGDATLLTGGEGRDAPEQAMYPENSDTDGNDADAALQVPENPDGYALNFADADSVDTALLAQYTSLAHEMGLNRSQAAKLAAMYENHVSGQVQRQMETLREAEKGWLAELRADKGFTVDMTHARRAVEQYGSPELMSVLEETRMGSHPVMVRFMAKIGKALAEPGFRATSGAGANKSAAEVLYPGHAAR